MQRGVIHIEGQGLNSTAEDYTNIIARSVEVNAGLWANQLRISAGAGEVNANDLSTNDTTTHTADQPTYALDVSALGGMYAQKIALIGTEQGLGVRNAGHIGAAAGNVTIDHQGFLINSGHITSTDNLEITTKDNLANTGTVYTRSDMLIQTDASIHNDGNLFAQNDLSLNAIGTNSQITGTTHSQIIAGLEPDTPLRDLSTISITATESISLHGQNLANKSQTYSSNKVDLSQSEIITNQLNINATQGDARLVGSNIKVNNALNIHAQDTIYTDQANIAANQLNLKAHNLSNINGTLSHLSDQALSLELSDFNNNQGTLFSNSLNFSVSTNTLNNSEGNISHNNSGTLSIDSQEIEGRAGKISSSGQLNLTTQNLNNTSGKLISTRNLNISAEHINNNDGTIGSLENDVQLNVAETLHNLDGYIESALNLNLETQEIDNTKGYLLAQKIQINTKDQALNNHRGYIIATNEDTDSLNIESGQLINTGGWIQSKGKVTLNTQDSSLTNNQINKEGGIYGHQIEVKTATLNNQTGLIHAQENLTLSATNISNQNHGMISSQNSLEVSAENLNNRQGKIHSSNTLNLSVNETLDNQQGQIYSQELNIQSQTLDNRFTENGISGNILNIKADTLNNQQGNIKTDDQTELNIHNTLENKLGNISSNGSLAIKGQDLNLTNQQGSIVADGLNIQTKSLTGNGDLFSLEDLNLNLTTNYNNIGQIQANQNLTLSTTGTLTNQSELFAGHDLNLQAQQINNTAQGLINGHNIQAKTIGTLTNRGLIKASHTNHIETSTLNNLGTGRIYGSNVAINAINLTNKAEGNFSPVIASHQQINLGIQDTLENSEYALIYSDGSLNISGALNTDLTINSNSYTNNILNKSATIEARDDLQIHAKNLKNINDHLEYKVVHDQTSHHRIYQTSIGALPSSEIAWFKEYSNRSKGVYALPKNHSYSDPKYQAYFNDLDPITQDWDFSNNIYNYSKDDPIWGVFGLENPTMTAQEIDRYNQSYDDGYYWGGEPIANPWNELNARVQSMKTSVEQDLIRVYSYKDYTQTDYKPVITQTAPGQIISGDNMTLRINQTTHNQDSHILAGKNLTLVTPNLQNQSTEIDTQTIKSGINADWKHYKTVDRITYTSKRYKWVDTNYHETITKTKTVESDIKQNTNTKATGFSQELVQNHVFSGKKVETQEIFEIPQQLTTDPILTLPESQQPNLENPIVIRTTSPALPTTQNMLFKEASNKQNYIIETDPDFTNRKQWLSSDYMLTMLGTDPATTQKRIGDGFYEQKIIREQIAQLTGQRFLQNYQDDEAQFTALMENAMTFAQQHQIRPGVALSQEQMSQLTSDMVWLVEQDVALADGTTTKALVPQVYALVQPGDLDGSGALFSAQNMQLNLDDAFINNGQLLAKDSIQIHANDIQHSGNIQASDIYAQAEKNFNLLGGKLSAEHSMSLIAGNDLNIETTLSENETISKNANFSSTDINRQASLFLKGNDENNALNLIAGNQLNIKGAQIESQANLNLQAANIDINTVETTQSHDVSYKKGYAKGESTKQHQSTLSAQNINLNADQLISVTGASIQANENLALQAQAVLLHSAHDSQSFESKHKSKGAWGTKSEAHDQGQFTQALSTELQANDIQISTQTLQMVGSTIEAEIANIEAELIQLISDKNSSYANSYTDGSGILLRSINIEGQHKETVVESAIQASKLIVNDQDTIKHTLDSDQLISRISSEHPELSNDQIELIQANLTNKEWDQQITTLSETGAIIVQAVVTYLTAGAASGLVSSSSAALNAAVDAAVQSMIREATSQAVTAALTGNYDFDLEGLATNALKSGVTAGMGQYSQELLVKHELTGLTGDTLNLAQKAATQTALYGGDFEENLTNTLVTDIAAKSANVIGDKTDAGSLANISSHAVLGCGAASAQGQDCASGAAGGALSATLAPQVGDAVDDGDNEFTKDEKAQIRVYTQVLSTLALSNTELDLVTADQATQNELDNNFLAHLITAAIITDVFLADNGEQKVILERSCATGDTECTPKVELSLADLENHQIRYDPQTKSVYVFNHGINNTEEQALENAKQQHGNEALSAGVYTVINPKTTNIVSEAVYAGLDKAREFLGEYNFLGVSNATKTNMALEQKLIQMNQGKNPGSMISIDQENHSRGTLTSSNSLTAHWQQGNTNVPINSITYNGGAANAQNAANTLNKVTINTTTFNTNKLYQSTHKDDWVGTLIGGNTPTGGFSTGFGNAHSAYGSSANRSIADPAWGAGQNSIKVEVKPNN